MPLPRRLMMPPRFLSGDSVFYCHLSLYERTPTDSAVSASSLGPMVEDVRSVARPASPPIIPRIVRIDQATGLASVAAEVRVPVQCITVNPLSVRLFGAATIMAHPGQPILFQVLFLRLALALFVIFRRVSRELQELHPYIREPFIVVLCLR